MVVLWSGSFIVASASSGLPVQCLPGVARRCVVALQSVYREQARATTSPASSPVLRHSLTSVRFPLPVWPTRVMNVSVTATPCQERTEMKTFTIDNDNNISVFAIPEEAAAATATPFDSFASQQELADLAAQWPADRLLAVWNSLPGVTPVKKFTDRKTAIGRIWARIQGLGEPVTQKGGTTVGATVSTPASKPAATPASNAEPKAGQPAKPKTEPKAT